MALTSAPRPPGVEPDPDPQGARPESQRATEQRTAEERETVGTHDGRGASHPNNNPTPITANIHTAGTVAGNTPQNARTDPKGSGRNPRTKQANTNVSNTEETAKMRKMYSQVFHEAHRFLETMSTIIHPHIDPRDSKALSQFFTKMSEDITVDAKLPSFAAGTMCANILDGLAILTRKATKRCTPRMARAAHTTWQHTDTGRHNGAPDTNDVNNTPNAGTSPTNDTSHGHPIQPNPTDSIAPYLRAARKPARPLGRLPIVHRDNSVTLQKALAEGTTFTGKLRARAARVTDTLIGPEQKNLLEITSDTTLASPTQLRQVLKLGGITTPIAVLPTEDNRRAYVCASDSTLDKIGDSYANFTKLSRASRRQPPILKFRKIGGVEDLTSSTTHAQETVRTLRREIHRLENDDCAWSPRLHFARRLREIETTVHAKLVHLDGNEAPAALAANPRTHRPNKRSRATLTPDEETDSQENSTDHNEPMLQG